MKILIFSVFIPLCLSISPSSFGAYTKAKLQDELSALKKGLYQSPEIQKILEQEDDEQTKVDEQMTLNELEDLEEVYFDKVSTKNAAPKVKRSR